VKPLLDEMYPARLAVALRARGIEAATVAELGLAGAADPDVFAAAVAAGFALLTENVGDFTRLAADHSTTGRHHHGLLIALSSRFSRQPTGFAALIAAVTEAAGRSLSDRVVYLKHKT
jgi:predicted nuclease of predicted toxin-antitoxin system